MASRCDRIFPSMEANSEDAGTVATRSEPPAAALSMITTEHFVLQGARAATISESTGRAGMFLSAVSGGSRRSWFDRHRNTRGVGVLRVRAGAAVDAGADRPDDLPAGLAKGDRGPWLRSPDLAAASVLFLAGPPADRLHAAGSRARGDLGTRALGRSRSGVLDDGRDGGGGHGGARGRVCRAAVLGPVRPPAGSRPQRRGGGRGRVAVWAPRISACRLDPHRLRGFRARGRVVVIE